MIYQEPIVLTDGIHLPRAAFTTVVNKRSATPSLKFNGSLVTNLGSTSSVIAPIGASATKSINAVASF